MLIFIEEIANFCHLLLIAIRFEESKELFTVFPSLKVILPIFEICAIQGDWSQRNFNNSFLYHSTIIGL